MVPHQDVPECKLPHSWNAQPIQDESCLFVPRSRGDPGSYETVLICGKRPGYSPVSFHSSKFERLYASPLIFYGRFLTMWLPSWWYFSATCFVDMAHEDLFSPIIEAWQIKGANFILSLSEIFWRVIPMQCSMLQSGLMLRYIDKFSGAKYSNRLASRHEFDCFGHDFILCFNSRLLRQWQVPFLVLYQPNGFLEIELQQHSTVGKSIRSSNRQCDRNLEIYFKAVSRWGFSLYQLALPYSSNLSRPLLHQLRIMSSSMREL